MKKDIAKKWVKALRSGKYKQGKHALKTETKHGTQHCCLGVLCELYQQDRKRKQTLPLTIRTFTTTEAEKSTIGRLPSNVKKIFAFGRDEFTTVVPPSVQKWAGLADSAGEFREGKTSLPKLSAGAKVCDSLAELNDAGASFKRIADIIENAVEDL